MKRFAQIGLLAALAGGAAMCAENQAPRKGTPRSNGVASKPTTAKPNLDLNFPKKPAVKAESSQLLGPVPSAISTIDRWNRMNPEQRSRSLAKLPPERRQKIQERLDRFNALPKEEQDRMRRRYERFSHLTPERQAVVRRQIEAFGKLPEGRRGKISREFEQLRRMDPEERRARINSEEFRNRYNPREQQLLSDLSENLAVRSAR